MVKALDLKSNGVSPRRFESCRLRQTFISFDFRIPHFKYKYFVNFAQPGSVARPVISASERLASVDGLRTGSLSRRGSCRTGVRAKPCVHMGISEESGVSRWSEEVRSGPGGETQQLKAPAWCSSGTAPVSGRSEAAHPIQADQKPILIRTPLLMDSFTLICL